MLPNAFITLLTTPSYLPGALVLLHSLFELHPAPRDFKTVCLVTPETVDAKTIGELRKAGYDFVIGVEPIGSGASGAKGLAAMGRPDLNFALTKLHLFRLHSLFSTLIYLDADVLPLRPLSHLFTTTNPHHLSACPDTGWPDCFNSGVMVVRPRQSDWDGLRALLKNGEGEDGIYMEGGADGNGSFDGADQGLLNEWFSEEGGGGQWNRLPFTYNVTPSAAYTYKPAYQRYGHKINVVHFIGPNKPWANLQNRPAGMSLSSQNKQSFEYPALIDRWFDVYDRNVRSAAAQAPDQAKRFAVPEHVAVWNQTGIQTQPADRLDLDQLREAVNKGVSSLKPGQYTSLPLDGRVDLIMPKPKPKSKVRFEAPASASPTAMTSPTQYRAPKPQTMQQQMSQPATWDASRYSPPKEGKPEMQIRMDTRYNPAWEQSVSQQSSYYAHHPPAAEPQYPTLPASVTNDQWYKDYQGRVPDQKNIKPVFPWEQAGGKQRRPDRVFPQGDQPVQYTSDTSSGPTLSVQTPTPPANPPREPSPPIQQKSMVEAMASYKNAWDTMPSIQRYVEGITGKPKRNAAPTGLGIRRESTFDPASIQSVPPTPKAELTQSKANRHRHLDSIDRHSNASGDGDDEEEDDSSEGDAGSSPVVPTSEWQKTSANAPKASYSPNLNYSDRDAQTDGSHMTDAKVQAIPGGGPSPAVKTVNLPDPSAIATKPRPARHGSSSDTPTPRGGGLVTPPSDSNSSRRVLNNLVPAVSGTQTTPSRTFPPSSYSSQSSSFQPSHSARSSYSHQYGAMPHHGGRKPSIDAMTNEGVPVSPPLSSSAAGDGMAHGPPGSRYFDPKTDVDVRKRDTQKVLSQFMKVGGFGQPEPAARE